MSDYLTHVTLGTVAGIFTQLSTAIFAPSHSTSPGPLNNRMPDSICMEPSYGPALLPVAILCIVLAVITISGNLLIITAVLKDPLGELRTNSDHLIMNLAVADLCVGLIGEPIIALQHWIPGLSRSDLANATLYFGVEASCFAVIVLTVERFIVIEFPIHNVQLLTPDRLKVCIAITWILSLFIALLPLMGWRSSRQYRLFLYDVIGFIFFIILFGLYIRMFVVMRRYNRSLLELQECSVQQQSLAAARVREQEVTKAIFMFFGVYTLCWAPSVVVENINFFQCRADGGTSTLQHLCKFAGLLNSALNPLLYGLRMRKFRRAVIHLLPCCQSDDAGINDLRPLIR